MACGNKILVIAPSWIGDLVMSQALLRLLKKEDPLSVIDVFASPSLHPLLRRMPEVDNCIASPLQHGELNLFLRFKLAKILRANSYTHSYVLPNSFKSALIPFLARIPHRIGWRGECRYGLLNDIRVLSKEMLLVVKRYLALGYKRGAKVESNFLLPQLQTTREQVTATLKRLQISPLGRPILAICPGAEYGSAKRWPPNYFADLATFKKNDGWEIWILGGKQDQMLAQEIQELCYGVSVDLTGKTDLGEVVDLLSLATVVVANDSGLMHIAASLGRPVVAIYGATSPDCAPPLTLGKHRTLYLHLPCSPCRKRVCPLKHNQCMYDTRPNLVLKSIADLD